MYTFRPPAHATATRAAAIVALLLLVFVVGACGKSVTSTTAGGSTTDSGSTSSTSGSAATTVSSEVSGPAGPGPFSSPAYLPATAVDLSKVGNLDRVKLSDAQKQVLEKQSFVAVAPAPADQSWKFWQVYENARYQGLPLLVTTDSLLNVYHEVFDTLLQHMEEAQLLQQADKMTEALYNAASDQWNTATDETIKEDARLNMAYFAVANSLFKGANAAPDVVGDEVDAELALIEAAAVQDKSPILGYTEDYTQFKPRGHYTRSEALKRYFKGMMWYGQTGFFVNPRDPDISEGLAASLTRRAVLVASSLAGPAKDAWTAIYEPTRFLVGNSDDLTVDDMAQVLSKVFGTAQPAPDDLADAAKIASVRSELNKLPAPKILSQVVPLIPSNGQTANAQARLETERSFRVMGQRYIPDSYAFTQLVWPNVGEASNKRDLPMGLDVMTVLGSDQAYQIAKNDFGQTAFKNWDTQLHLVNQQFTAKNSDFWPENLYTGWLEALQTAMAFPGPAAPDFMRTQVWARKSLNAALGSWTELRHDTILYAKQSVTAEGDGGELPQTVGYVEPYPAFFARIAELASAMRDGLAKYGLLDNDAAGKLENMITLSTTLKSIADKELAGQALSEDERATIDEYGGFLENLEQFTSSEEGRTLSPTPEKSALVADVHSSYNTGSALEEATGYPQLLYAAFEVDGKLQLLAGASYAYYEFTAPLDRRLTDEEWISTLDSSKAPPRPAWTDAWIVTK